MMKNGKIIVNTKKERNFLIFNLLKLGKAMAVRPKN